MPATRRADFNWKLVNAFCIAATLLLNGCGGDTPDPPVPPAPGPTAIAPSISSQPIAQTVTEPAAVTFNVTASGTPTPTYQWQRSTNGITFSDIAGATGSSYNTGATTASQSGYAYRVVVTNSANSVTSNSATLTVNAATAAPSISAQATSQAVTEPAAATFSVTASGVPAPTYQWQRSTNGTTFTDIAGAIASSYNTGATTVAQSGHLYRVVVTNSINSVTSNAATLTVNAAPTVPVISSQPASQAVAEPATATFSVAATGNPAPSYQWQLSTDGGSYANIPGATASSFTTGATSVAQSGYRYRAVATNIAGSATSDSAQLSVSATASGATIIFSRNNGNVNVSNYDLYAVRESGGAEIQLTSSTDNEGICGVTPAGRVIFVRGSAVTGNDIYSIKPDGTDLRTLANSADDEICLKIVASGPAAGRVIYRRNTATSRDLYAVNADGTVNTPLANGPLNEDFAGITTNGTVIFQTDPFQDSNIYAVDLEGLSVVPLATSFRYEGVAGINGNTVIYGVDMFGQGDLYSVDTLGVNTVPIATDPTTDESLAGISPVGTLMIHTQAPQSSNRDLYAGSMGIAVSSDFEIYAGSTASGRVLYQVQFNNNSDLYSVFADATGRVALAQSADSEGLAYLTSDGRAIFERYAITGSTVTLGDIYIVDLDGAHLTPLATTVHHETFAAMVGSKVLYRRETANSVNDIQLWAVNGSGTGAFRLFTLGGPAEFVAATPSAKVLVNNYTGIPNLYIVNTDGTDQRLLATNATFNAMIP